MDRQFSAACVTTRSTSKNLQGPCLAPRERLDPSPRKGDTEIGGVKLPLPISPNPVFGPILKEEIRLGTSVSWIKSTGTGSANRESVRLDGGPEGRLHRSNAVAAANQHQLIA